MMEKLWLTPASSEPTIVMEPTQKRMQAETKPSVKRLPSVFPRSTFALSQSPAPLIRSSRRSSVPSSVPSAMQTITQSRSPVVIALDTPMTMVTRPSAAMIAFV